MTRILAATVAALCMTVSPAYAGDDDVVSMPVSFRVTNSNGSALACPADHLGYTVRGHLVLPGDDDAAGTVSLYLHGFAVTEFGWRFGGRLDHAAAMARLGHASVTIERIGWDDAGRPHGTAACVGSAADVAGQIAGQLRAGRYTAPRRVAFRRVVLAGHETGGAVAQVAAYSGAPIDGLVVIGYHNQGITDEAEAVFADTLARCARGGEDAVSETPGGGYVPPPAAFIRASGFHDVDQRVVEAVTARLEKNPCGEAVSLAAEFAAGPRLLRHVAVPVLLLQPEHDNVFDPSGAARQRDHYRADADVTFRMLEDTGHFPMFEAQAPAFRRALSRWLLTRWGD